MTTDYGDRDEPPDEIVDAGEAWDPIADQDADLIYPSLEAWVRDWLVDIVRRPTRPGAWCSTWWAHPEAVSRLAALWAAWEAAQVEGGSGPSGWWVYHFAGQWQVLTDERDGPFAGCVNSHYDPPVTLTIEPVPDLGENP